MQVLLKKKKKKKLPMQETFKMVTIHILLLINACYISLMAAQVAFIPSCS